MALKNIIGYLILIIVLPGNLRARATGELQKCCISDETYDIESDECVKNTNNYTLEIPSIPMEKSLEIKTLKYGLEIHLENSSINELKIEIDKYGNLIKYDNESSSIAGIYKRFCIDLESESGEKIALILLNVWRIKICENFQPNILESKCRNDNGTTNLTDHLYDLEKIPGLEGLATPNVELVVSDYRKYEHFVDYERKENVPYYFTHNGAELTIGKHAFKDYCIRKLNDKWTTLIKIKLINFFSPYLELLSIVLLFILIHQYFDKDLLLKKHVQFLMFYSIFLVASNILNIIINVTINSYLILFKNGVVIIACSFLSSIWCELGLKHLNARMRGIYFILLPIFAFIGIIITFTCHFKFPEFGEFFGVYKDFIIGTLFFSDPSIVQFFLMTATFFFNSNFYICSIYDIKTTDLTFEFYEKYVSFLFFNFL
jgi:hypothetical protein